MPIIQAQAPGASRHDPRHAALDHLRNPANWQRVGSVRRHLRHAITTSDLPARVQLFGLWLSDRLTEDGDLRAGTLADVLALCPLPERTARRHLGQLERAGLVERHGSARRVGPGEYRRFVVVSAAAEIRGRAANSTPPPIEASDLQSCHPWPNPYRDKGVLPLVPSSVGGRPPAATRARARARQRELEQAAIDDTERRMVRDHWPLLARSRTDLPGFRPGYEDNITFDPEARRRLGIPDRPSWERGDPLLLPAVEGPY